MCMILVKYIVETQQYWNFLSRVYRFWELWVGHNNPPGAYTLLAVQIYAIWGCSMLISLQSVICSAHFWNLAFLRMCEMYRQLFRLLRHLFISFTSFIIFCSIQLIMLNYKRKFKMCLPVDCKPLFINFFSHGQDGFVNSLDIAKSGRFIVAGVGQVCKLCSPFRRQFICLILQLSLVSCNSFFYYLEIWVKKCSGKHPA